MKLDRLRWIAFALCSALSSVGCAAATPPPAPMTVSTTRINAAALDGEAEAAPRVGKAQRSFALDPSSPDADEKEPRREHGRHGREWK